MGFEVVDHDEVEDSVVNTVPYSVPMELKSLFLIQDDEDVQDVFSARGM